MDRVYNFSAGPSMLPLPVLEQAQRDLVCYPGAGCSVMEMSHRSHAYEAIIARAEETLRKLMQIPEDYAVLFLQGGASLQFSMVPMNLVKRGGTADYAVTGVFAKKAFAEAKRWCCANAVSDGSLSGYTTIPDLTPDMLSPDASYLHITGNNTIYGTAYRTEPETNGIPLVADWSSAILSRVIDVNKYTLIYAGAQKNMGIAGVTVVIVKKSAIPDEIDSVVPSMLQYKVMAETGSMYNTPPAFAIYVAGLVFQWVLDQGGVPALEKHNAEKAAILYSALDESKLFRPVAAKEFRSNMNVTFTLPDEKLTADFLRMAEERGLINIKGHRAVGGCRASIYNAMPTEGVVKLVECMRDFEKQVL
jgi:phosphoserine aminotransferase